MERPVDGISYAEASVILNRSTSWIGDRLRDGTLPRGPAHMKASLSRTAVEKLALELWRPRRHVAGGYWATTTEAAEILDVTSGRVRQLIACELLPAVRASGGSWLFRREQIVVVAKGRLARWR